MAPRPNRAGAGLAASGDDRMLEAALRVAGHLPSGRGPG
jgi:hypothetical protein